MFKSRRKFIKSVLSIGAYSLALANGFLHSSLANAQWLKGNFSHDNYVDTLNYLFKDADIINTTKITFSKLPRVAENGAVVPIQISSSIENVEKIYILVEKNPFPLSAEFYLYPAVKPQVSSRLKMAETSDVIVIVEAEGKLYRRAKSVKVTVGGCG